MIFWICITCLIIVLMQMLFLILSWKINFARTQGVPVDRPMVSVLVAARNEEDKIIYCLEALSQMDYPSECVEVLIGNDGSEDRTLQVVRDFIRDKKNFFCYDIKGTYGKARGKANVLAQLAEKAGGKYLFFTDADTRVGKNWIKAMLAGFYSDTNVGVVTGVTTIEGERMFDRMQAIDWLYALGMVKVMSDFNMPVTAMGNNMAVKQQAYADTGGYQRIPFSVTEDYALFHEITKCGWSFFHVFNTECLGNCIPVESLKSLLHQRKRWMYGVMGLPWYLLAFLIGQAAFYLCILITLILAPVPALIIWGVKLLLQSLFIGFVANRTGCGHLKKYLLLFEGYSITITFLTAVFYLLPLRFQWKGRAYT